jgi:hypothetical protein
VWHAVIASIHSTVVANFASVATTLPVIGRAILLVISARCFQ